MTSARRAPLDETERAALNRVVGAMRTILTRELSRVLEGTFGIKIGSAEPEDESRLILGPDEIEARRELVGLWDALGRRAELLVREAAFTHTNRLVAIRVAEAIELLPESLARGRRSSGFRQILEVAPLLGSDDDAGYWEYLQLCGDELAHDVPRLFDPRNPLLALRPPPSVIDDLVALLSGDDLGGPSEHGPAWAAPDAFGWTYQFFNSDDERTEMRRQHPQPVDSWELAVRNQFFTPDYVVDFLVHNSLGRRLVEAGVHELVDDLEYLVDPPTELGEPLDLVDVKVLDPACGSGHFLLGAFDVIERAWSHRGVQPPDAAGSIVESLWGIDIDDRAAQVAAAAIMFRARRDNPDGDLPTPNIVCARAVPGGPASRAELLSSVDASRRDFLTELIDQLDQAPELGSLLKVDDLLQGETARFMTFGGGRKQTTRRGSNRATNAVSFLDDDTEGANFDVGAVVDAVLAVAQAASDEVTSTPIERVLAAEGGDALRLVQALSRRYDAVLMNPPFGEPIPDTKEYLKAAYPWIPTKDHNLLAAFVGRGLELCNASGYLGAITSRSGMFLTTFERWRKEVLIGNDLTVLADLGHKVMHEALVEAAAYVVRPGQSRHSRPATFIRLLREPPETRPAALREVCSHLRAGTPDGRVFHVTPDAFDAVPGAPMAYWTSPDIRRLFTDFPPLEGHGAEVRQGLATGDDFRFVRAFWEVDPSRIGRSRDETFAGQRWVPFAKGGEYSPFWADIHLVVDYERDGEQLREFPGARPQNLQYFFRPGLTWPLRTQGGFNPRLLPAGCAFGHKGPGIFSGSGADGSLRLLGMLLSRPSIYAIELIATFGSYEVGAVARLPTWNEATGEELARLTKDVVVFKWEHDKFNETARSFLRPLAAISIRDAVQQERQLVAKAADLLDRWDAVDQGLAKELSLDTDALDMLDEEVGAIPVRPHAGVTTGARAPRWIDDELEGEAAHSGRSVHELVTGADSAWLMQRSRVAGAPGQLISYLVGCAFGRWDVRVGRDPSMAAPTSDDPFAPVPVCPPGMLVGPDGLPASGAPVGYPLYLSEHRVLVDEPGHPADLCAAVEAAAAALVDDPRALLDEVIEVLGPTDLRAYLSKRFFKDHLSRYSKSRRKAPIYWPLTTPSRAWTVWVYAPTLSREAIYSVAAHAERRLNAAEVEIRRMESAQLQASAPGTTTHDPALVRTLAGRLDVERRLGEELRSFRRVVTRVAESGWSPNLDDGIVLCAAPFAEIFLDWPKELADIRKQLRAGKFPWSSIHRHRESL